MQRKTFRANVLTTASMLASAALMAQEVPVISADDVPLDTYLFALGQISPAAREGAEAYMEAFRARCGRAMHTVELRRAVAEGSGNPTLMAMMRAAHTRDAATLKQLSGAVACPRG